MFIVGVLLSTGELPGICSELCDYSAYNSLRLAFHIQFCHFI